MKRYILFLIILIVLFSAIRVNNNSIRVRVIASSNSISDQNVKLEVRDKLMKKLSKMLKNADTYKESRQIITNNIDSISNEISNVLAKYSETYTINYGMNYFPEKTYNNVKYKEGKYESLVVTIGEGQGNNWWCFLFPPFCLLEAEETENNDIEYTTYFSEIISKLFK